MSPGEFCLLVVSATVLVLGINHALVLRDIRRIKRAAAADRERYERDHD